MQLSFRKIELVQGLTIFLMVMIAAWWRVRLPDRIELGWRVASLELTPVELDPSGFGNLRLAGAWTLRSDDHRLGGVSALALTSEGFVALSDGGVVARFARPSSGRQSAMIEELPSGPGRAGFKANRDSESIEWDAASGRWRVAFENVNEIWLYDKSFRHGVAWARFGRKQWPRNRGIEAMTADRDGLLIFPEKGDSVVRLSAGSARILRIENPAGRISDAVRLPSDELLVVNRHPTLLGISNSIALLEPTQLGCRYGVRIPLHLGRFDNVEAIAAERLANGNTRLWLMTDDGNQRPFRTLLIALDVPLKRRVPLPPS